MPCALSLASAIPVSYTHLDVYKRQVKDFAEDAIEHVKDLTEDAVEKVKDLADDFPENAKKVADDATAAVKGLIDDDKQDPPAPTA